MIIYMLHRLAFNVFMFVTIYVYEVEIQRISDIQNFDFSSVVEFMIWKK